MVPALSSLAPLSSVLSGMDARRGDFELLDGALDFHPHLLDVVVHPVQERSLIDDETREVLEHVG